MRRLWSACRLIEPSIQDSSALSRLLRPSGLLSNCFSTGCPSGNESLHHQHSSSGNAEPLLGTRDLPGQPIAARSLHSHLHLRHQHPSFVLQRHTQLLCLASHAVAHTVRLHSSLSSLDQDGMDSASRLLTQIQSKTWPRAQLRTHLLQNFSPVVWEELASLCMNTSQHFTGPQACDILWAFGVVGFFPSHVFTMLQEVLLEHVSECGCDGVVAALWALALSNNADQQVITVLSDRLWEQSHELSLHHVAVAASALACFPHYDQDKAEVMAALASRASQQLGVASGAQVAMVLRAFACIRHEHNELFRQATQVLVNEGGAGHMALMSPADLCTCMAACAVMRHQDPVFWQEAAEQLMSAQLHPDYLPLSHPESQGHTFPSTLLDVPGHTGHTFVTHQPSAVSPRGVFQPRVTEPDPPAATCARGPREHSTSRAVAQETVRSHSRNNPSHPQAALQPVSCDFQVPPSLQPSCTILSDPPCDPYCSLEHVTAAHSSGHTAAGGEESEIRIARSGALTPQSLVAAVWAVAVSGHWSPQLMSAAFWVVANLPPGALSDHDLVLLYITQLKAWELALDKDPVKPQEAQVASAWSRRLRSQGVPSQVLLPSHLLQRAFVMTQHVHELSAGDPITVYFLKRLQTAMADLGHARLPVASTVDAALPISLGYHLPQGVHLAVEVVRAHEFTRTVPRQMCAPALTRLQLLRFRGWRVIIIPEHEVAELPQDDASAWKTYMAAKLHLCLAELAAPAGVSGVGSKSKGSAGRVRTWGKAWVKAQSGKGTEGGEAGGGGGGGGSGGGGVGSGASAARGAAQEGGEESSTAKPVGPTSKL